MFKIEQKERIIEKGASPAHRKLILDAMEHTVNKLLPDVLMRDRVKYADGKLTVEGQGFVCSGKIFVIGAGKAAGRMAEAIEKLVPVEKGIVSVLRGTKADFNCKKIELIEATHPFPDNGSVEAAERMIGLSKIVTEDDLVVCLISGGGSSLLAKPEEGLSLEEKISTVKRLMNAGADIKELNNVRKSLSAVKGGKLAMHFRKAQIVNIVLSDVIGNPLSVIASGPTIIDRWNYADAKLVLEKYGMWDIEKAYCQIIERGIVAAKPPLTLDKSRPKIASVIIGDNTLAVRIAANYLKKNGVEVQEYLEITGDATVAGTDLSNLLNKGESFVAGGETTVKVVGKGEGGRNQELALSAAMHLRKGTLASMGTDGIDGNSEGAGAIVDSETLKEGQKSGMGAKEYLSNNDSAAYLKKCRSQLVTGPSGTNVCDLIIGLV